MNPITPYLIANADQLAEGGYLALDANLNDNDGDGLADATDNTLVNGPDDLREFIPVYLDLSGLVATLPPSAGFIYKLRQTDSALNFVYTNLTPTTAFAYRDAPASGFGPGLDQPAASAPTHQITAEGVDLFAGLTGSAAFLEAIRSQGGGIILIEARRTSSEPLVLSVAKADGTVLVEIPLPLMVSAPPTLAVDANRDGVIKFASEDASDATTSTRAYERWLNDDDDQAESFGSEVDGERLPVQQPDWENHLIDCQRDLEDFARMQVSVAGLVDSLKPKSDGTADLYLGLKWTDVSGTPAIKIYKHLEAGGGTGYLTDPVIAHHEYAERGLADTFPLGDASGQHPDYLVEGSSPYILPTSLFADLTESAPKTCLLFEGCKPGQGRLKMVILKPDGTEIGEGPGVWLDLKNIKSMYERAVATTGGPRSENGVDYTIPIPSDLTGPDDNNIPHPTMGWEPNPLGYPYEPDPAETKTYIVYVHGWRWSPEKANNRTETVFKRLWHLGYKGRLAALRWPTFYGGPDDDDSAPAGLFTYNNSEYRAWKSGESLKQYVNQLPSGYARNVVAHSMGNIVTGSALRSGMSVANYVMLNAAVPAMCYDESTSLHQADFNFTTPNTDSDAGTRALAYVGQLGTLNTNVVNFFLTRDTATRGLWELNNSAWRPQRYNLNTTGYAYDPAEIVGRRLYITFFTSLGRYLIDPHEAMPYACQSLTRTAGADGRTRGSIGTAVDMDASFAFDNEHGAEWDRNYMQTRAFYQRLLIALDSSP